ncbi:MAG TPA: HlyD family secretion protein, partial [Buttiauxella sp.]|uniref:HlyD family secretion protein n=1 Tax=Buttiauxella sp. TaxID=1972222 RepID=UPI002B45EEF7
GRIEDSDISLQPGSWISTSTHIATLVSADRWRAKALVGEEDLARLHVGAKAKIYQSGEGQPIIGRVVSIDHNAVTRLSSLLLAKDHGGPVQLNPTAPAKDLRPQGVWYRVWIEGDGKAAVLKRENRAEISIESQRQSLAHRWFNSVSLMLIQQTGMGKEG